MKVLLANYKGETKQNKTKLGWVGKLNSAFCFIDNKYEALKLSLPEAWTKYDFLIKSRMWRIRGKNNLLEGTGET